jgi:hypothetical protein
MAQIIKPEGLTEAAKKYDPILRTLPFVTLAQFAAALGLNVIEVENEDVIVNKRRQAGSTGPYKQGMTITYKEEVAKFVESILKPELVVSKTKDNILNYKDKKVLVMAGTALDLKTKKHPLEQMIVTDEIVSHAEDVVFSAFFSERDDDVFSPATAFTGFYPLLDALVAAGLIAADLGNVGNTGALAAPANSTDVDAYEKLVEWIGSSHNMLRSSQGGVPQLLAAQSVLKNARAAYRNKVKAFQMPSMQEVLEAIREDAFCPGLIFSTHEALGTGSKLVLQKMGNMDLGFNTNKSNQFCQVRNIFEDPNEVQFWIEAAYGTRVRDVHAKVFKTNEQTNTGLDLAGDYVASES